MNFTTAKIVAGAAFVAAGLVFSVPASAQQNVMKECGAKWQAAKAANKTGGKTWQQFLAQCRKDMASGSGNKGTAARKTTGDSKRTATPSRTSSRGAVFPTKVDSKYSKEKPGAARRKTCLDQYNANKARNNGAGNGGMKWIEKGGGYYSECNKRLKG